MTQVTAPPPATAGTATVGRPASRRAELLPLPDGELLARLRALPLGSQSRATACEILVARYEKLVRSCVRQYLGSPEPAEDLMQAGYLGLLKAINNFDPAFGGSLTAYALPCVTGEIKRHFRDKRWQVHVRRAAQERVLELRKATEQLTQALGRAPVDEELAERLGLSLAELAEARRADISFSVYSLDAPVTEGGDDAMALGDLLGAADDAVEQTVDMAAVAAHWDELPERDRRILTMRFYGNLTQSEIGERLGISQMHVSRLMTRALAHLRGRLLSDA